MRCPACLQPANLILPGLARRNALPPVIAYEQHGNLLRMVHLGEDTIP